MAIAQHVRFSPVDVYFIIDLTFRAQNTVSSSDEILNPIGTQEIALLQNEPWPNLPRFLFGVPINSRRSPDNFSHYGYVHKAKHVQGVRCEDER